jgi:DNA-binding transcriptional ArsR family regulator
MDSDVAEAFELLGDETRLRIVDALGELSEPGEFSTVSFGDLREAVGVRDSGNFNYHLQKLVPRFVASTDDGYRLALPGIFIYRALKAGLYERSDSDVVQETDETCDDCDEPLSMWIEASRATRGCRNCESIDNQYPLPAGALAQLPDANMEQLLFERVTFDKLSFLRGFCPYCSGSVFTDLSTPGDRPTPDGTDTPVVATVGCEWCHWYMHANVVGLLLGHPELLGFYYRHDMDPFFGSPTERFDVSVDVESSDPWRLVTELVAPDGERLRVVLDGSLDAIDRELQPVE